MRPSDDLFLDATVLMQDKEKSGVAQYDEELLHAIHTAVKQHQEKAEAEKVQINLILQGRSEPISIESNLVVSLGRADRHGKSIPTIDLGNDNGLELGVSRLHAKIFFANSSFYLKDMASMNGTWLNGLRLAPYQAVPIKPGDEIRLGSFVIVAN